jgi:spectinomycin phosphotransferase
LLDGVSGQFSRSLPASERGLLIDQLGELHRAAPPASTPVHVPQLATRSILERALSELDHPWRGGPFAEPTRALLREHLDAFRRRLDEFDRGISTLRGRERVVTHGEPHPGNVLRLAQRRLFVDWDTVGLAVPERDLWWVVRDSDDHARYAEASGRRPDPAMLALYRLRWDLDDASVYVGQFREAHRLTADAEKAWAGLIPTMERVVG